MRSARWRVRPRGGAVVGLLACLVVLAGCSATAPSGQAQAGAAAAPPAPPAPSAPAAPPPGAPAQPSAAEAGTDGALRLEALLGQHTIQAGDLMRGRLRNDEDFAQAANAAVGQNTEELAQQVGALGGADAAARFQGLWTDHVTALVNYSRGLATNDAAVRDEARARLDALNGEIADVVATATQGRLDRETVRTELRHARRPPGRAGGRLRREGLRARQHRATARGTSTPSGSAARWPPASCRRTRPPGSALRPGSCARR